MFALKGIILSILGYFTMLGSVNLSGLPLETYVPQESIVASDDQEQMPLFFDAILDFNQISTYQTSPGNVFLLEYKERYSVPLPLYYQLSYYRIGQDIVVNLTPKTIIFPFHCFT